MTNMRKKKKRNIEECNLKEKPDQVYKRAIELVIEI